MQRTFGAPLIATAEAEFAKYTAPILLLHGLWCTAAVWRPFMGYFSHLGWTSHALTLCGHGAPVDPGHIAQAGFGDHLAAVRHAIDACEATPVLMGHDLGALLAMHCGRHARAVVALAPLIPPPVGSGRGAVLARWRAGLARWWSPLLPEPKGPLAVEYAARRPPGGTTPESARLMDELAYRPYRLEGEPAVPTLLVAGQADAVSPPEQIERLAAETGAAVFRAEGAGHGLPWEPGWEKRVTTVHRWLVQQLGESLLRPVDEEEER
ncbi:MAG: alpha/beta hydrolase [Deltaproteobacteria bacterium]|jgi:pimeloyl-ACP methyl ester carboxylesterase|nr:alpha/beta hydrolase [Deltaproteobacteria bacterium]